MEAWIAEIYASMLDSYRRTLVAAGFAVEHMQPGDPFQRSSLWRASPLPIRQVMTPHTDRARHSDHAQWHSLTPRED